MNKGQKAFDNIKNDTYGMEAEPLVVYMEENDITNVENNFKALEIIIEKGLPLVEKDMIKQSANYNEYNIKFSWCKMKNASVQKTEEEFKILKEVLTSE